MVRGPLFYMKSIGSRSYTFDFRDRPHVRLASNWHRYHVHHPIHTYAVHDAAPAAKPVTRYRISVRKFLPRRTRDCSTETIQLRYFLKIDPTICLPASHRRAPAHQTIGPMYFDSKSHFQREYLWPTVRLRLVFVR